MTQNDLIELAKQKAVQYNLRPALVCAIIEQESGWNPWAVRYESEFYIHYLAKRYPDGPCTEAVCRAMSWGLMQVMGEDAREIGFSTSSLASLCDPAIGVSVGCQVFRNCLKRAKGDETRALLIWNGGANKDYPNQVMRRVPKYEQQEA